MLGKNFIRLTQILVVIGFFCLLELLVKKKMLDPLLIAPPSNFISKAYELIMDHEFIKCFVITSYEFAIATVLAIIIGISFGFLCGVTILRYSLGPYLLFFFMLPKITLLPIFTLAFGLGELMKILFGFFHGFFPIAINVMYGIMQVRRPLIDVAKVMGASQLQIFHRVVFPYVLPTMLAGIRFGVILSLTGVILGEMWAGGGVGGLITVWMPKFKVSEVYSSILLMAIFSIVINELLLSLEIKAGRWR